VEDSVNVNGAELAGAGFRFFDKKANHALAHGLWRAAGPQSVRISGFVRLRLRGDEIGQGNVPYALVFPGIKEEPQFRGTFQPGVVFPGEIGELAKVRDDGRLKLFFEERHELQADAGARAFGVAVGGVLAPGLAAETEIVAKIGAAEFEERAENGAGFGMDAAEAGESSAAEDVSENGFGLVVGSVGDGDFVELAFGDEALKEGVAGAAGGVFEVGALAFGFGGDVFADDEELQGVLGGEIGDEFFVGVGSAPAQFVIEVDDGENEAKFFAQFEEEMEESDGIGAAGNGDPDALAGAEVWRVDRGEELGSG
jgi:hypothetical protein